MNFRFGAFFLLTVAMIISSFVAACGGSTPPEANKKQAVTVDKTEFMAVMDAAKTGDYQAQRNLAYGYASAPYPGQEKNRVLACSWYLVIANSGNERIGDADRSNANVYCGALEKELLETAKTNASQLLEEIYGAGKSKPVDAAPKLGIGNLKNFIDATKRHMADIHDSGLDAGSVALTLWGADHMKWSELQEVPDGKYAMVMKDSDSQRGKKICTNGRVIEIAVDRSVPDKKIFIGGMYDDAGRIYRFIAVHSTGEIVANSRAKFCGIITGQQHYPNSAGGMAHAVHLVGMFDLPENKK